MSNNAGLVEGARETARPGGRNLSTAWENVQMSGIAGVIDLGARHAVPVGTIVAMQDALLHRGPDEGGLLERPGLAFASRRLRLGRAGGQQPLSNEGRT